MERFAGRGGCEMRGVGVLGKFESTRQTVRKDKSNPYLGDEDSDSTPAMSPTSTKATRERKFGERIIILGA